MRICPRCNGRNIGFQKYIDSQVKRKNVLTSVAVNYYRFVYQCIDCGNYAMSTISQDDALNEWETNTVYDRMSKRNLI